MSTVCAKSSLPDQPFKTAEVWRGGNTCWQQKGDLCESISVELLRFCELGFERGFLILQRGDLALFVNVVKT